MYNHQTWCFNFTELSKLFWTSYEYAIHINKYTWVHSLQSRTPEHFTTSNKNFQSINFSLQFFPLTTNTFSIYFSFSLPKIENQIVFLSVSSCPLKSSDTRVFWGWGPEFLPQYELFTYPQSRFHKQHVGTSHIFLYFSTIIFELLPVKSPKTFFL